MINWWRIRTGHLWSGISKICNSEFWIENHAYFFADFHSSHDRTGGLRPMDTPSKRNLSCIDANGIPQEFLWRVLPDPFQDKWTFKVETQEKWLSGECFDLVVE